MTTRVPFCFVDVFAWQPLTGNPLSLVMDADELPEPQMRAIAREFSRIQVSVSGPRVRVGGSGLVVAEGTLKL